MEHSWDGIERRVMNLVAQHPAEADAPRVGVDADGLSAHVAIHNIQFDTSGFDLESDAGLSSGPRLVKSLLPEQGASLAYDGETGHYISTHLRLTAPVVRAITRKGV